MCVCLCACVCTCVCVCVPVYVCVYLCMCVCMSVCMCVYLYVCVCGCMQQGPGQGQWRYLSAVSSSVDVSGLQRGTQYQVQVRARTMAGYGNFSPASSFHTLPDGEASPRLLSGLLEPVDVDVVFDVVVVQKARAAHTS